MRKIIIAILVILLFPCFVFAQDDGKAGKIFKAEVVEIIKEQTTTLPDNSLARQQNIKLRGLDSEFKGKEVIFIGIGDFDVIKKNIYKINDKVLVLESLDDESQARYYIIDYVRTNSLWWLAAVFLLSLLIVGGWKGIRSIIALAITFIVIIKYIIPQILSGSSPILVSLLGSLIILLVIIYLTEGFRPRSHIAMVSILASLVITVLLSWFFVGIAQLSGLSGEEAGLLFNLGENVINFKGLLLAAIIIGALGVLDDVVISQVSTVEQIIQADKYQANSEIFKKAYKVGVSHVSSMTNTLFLAYAGASLPLLILFVSGQSAFSTWGQVINSEQIATEIVRALSGSIGLILAVPISTVISVYWLKK